MESPSRGGEVSRTVGWAALALWLVVVGLWIADVHGAARSAGAEAVAVPSTLSQAAVLLAAAMLAAFLALWVRRTWSSGAAGKILLALLAVSLVVKVAGMQFELLDHPRSDEGVYLAEAQEINAGDPFPDLFNYGHFFYYLPALVLWIQGLFAGALSAIVERVYGLPGDFAVSRILLRGLAALFGALTVVPVFAAARRAAGLRAGTFAGLLIVLSTHYTETAQTVICDVPAGFFAALCLACVARLLDGENHRDYLWAGVAAGLAAASKYPGGVSAVAIVAMWLYWRLRSRSWHWGLLWAGLVSLATFSIAMPAMWLDLGRSFSGSGFDVFFGWRQYARGGWLGVVPPEGVLRWYGIRLVEDLGWIALVLGMVGLLFLAARNRRRTLALLGFPVFYLALIGSMNMVVLRNLQPVLPAVAVILGIGCSGWMVLGRRLGLAGPGEAGPPGRRRLAVLAVVGLAVAVLAAPGARTLAWVVAHNRAGTRELMRDWIEANVPHGAGILQEDYTPELEPRHYLTSRLRSVPGFTPRVMQEPKWDYVLVADTAYFRFLRPRYRTQDWHEQFAERYRTIFSWELAHEVRSGRFRSGPHLSLYRIDPGRVKHWARASFTRDDVAFVSAQDILRDDPADAIIFTWRWQFAVFKEYLQPGVYEVHLWSGAELPEAYVHVVTPNNREIANVRVDHGVTVTIPEKGKYLVRVFQVPGTQLRKLELVPRD